MNSTKRMSQILLFYLLYQLTFIFCTNIISEYDDGKIFKLDLKMPNVLPQKHDEYFCSATNVTHNELYITRFDPNADMSKIHHIIIFGCSNLYSGKHLYPNYFSCTKSNLCSGQKIIYAWGRNAPSLTLPEGVGFHIGKFSSIKYLILQAHYSNPLQENDSSGVSLFYTLNRLPNIAGIFMLAVSDGFIPPNKQKSHLDINCELSRDPINVFAFRVHAHALGAVISGYKYLPHQNKWTMIAKGNPQWPQAFYPLEKIVRIEREDIIFGRCTYNSSQRHTTTYIGSTSSDEMCNFYMMYYSPNPLIVDPSKKMLTHSQMSFYSRFEDVCHDREIPVSRLGELPPGNDEKLPRNATLEESAFGQHSIHNYQHNNEHDKHFEHISGTHAKMFRYSVGSNYPFGVGKFGQITAIDVDDKNNIVIFHRGKHVWNERSFSMDNKYRLAEQGPISEPTIVTIDPLSQKIIDQWGENMFYLPHGLTVDSQNKAIWLTDVAMHQIFKFTLDQNSNNYKRKPDLILGERFVPGNDLKHFCKPTSVAIDSRNGDIYIADGYCNSRILRFNATGTPLNHWGHPPIYDGNSFNNPPPPNMFNVPHKIILMESSDETEKLACVADRENGRVQCFNTPYGYFKFQIVKEEFNERVFSIAYSAKDKLLYAVAGPSLVDTSREIYAFAFDSTTKKLITVLAPDSGTFKQPHDMAVSKDGNNVYVVEIGPNNIWMFNRGEINSNIPALTSPSSSSPKPKQIVISKISSLESKSFFDKFDTYLLRMRSKEYRYAASFNSTLFFVIFAIFALLFICHFRYSSRNYSILSFISLITCGLATICRRSRRKVREISSQKLKLTNFFGDRDKKFEREGFSRLPTNETDFIDHDDDDDDDEDILEDFNRTRKTTNQTPLV